MGYFEFDFRDLDEKRRENNHEPLVTIILTLLILMFMACMMSCRNTRTLGSDVQSHVMHADTSSHSTLSVMYTDMMRKAIDSLYRKQSELDSIIERSRQSLTVRSASLRSDSTNISDSMAIELDSIGNPHYHHYHSIYKESRVHDTLYVSKESSTYNERLKVLSDSMSNIRRQNDSVLLAYARLDSTYRQLADSVENDSHIVVEKKTSWFDEFLNKLGVIALIASVCCVAYFLARLLRLL